MQKRAPTPRQIKAAKPGSYGFGQGLYLKVSRAGNRSWYYRYTSPLTKRPNETAIGPALILSFEQAQSELAQMRAWVLNDQDPVQAKRQQRASETTFGQAADQWIEINQSGWSASQLRNANLRLKIHGKSLAVKVIAHIDADAVEAAIKPLWVKAPRQAHRTLAMWQRTFAYAKHKRLFLGDNPAEWKGNMEFRFGKPGKGKNYVALPYVEVPDFIRRLRIRQAKATSAVALEFVILTATRSGEVLGAQWSEFDLQNRTWTIPAQRMKRKDADHRVPLSDRAIEILTRQREYSNGSQFVFTGYNRTQMDEKSMRVLLRNMGIKVTVHGFRSSFKSWATEKTEHPWEIIELCLAHRVGTAVAQAYLRGDALEKRRAIMAAWALYCESKHDRS